MADWAKIILKTGLIATVMVALWAVFTQIQIPNISYNRVLDGAARGFAIIKYYCPAFPWVWNATLAMGGILVSLWTFRFAMVAIRWLFKVNE